MGHNFLPAILSPVSYLSDPTSRSAFSPALLPHPRPLHLLPLYLLPLYSPTSLPVHLLPIHILPLISCPPHLFASHLFAGPPLRPPILGLASLHSACSILPPLCLESPPGNRPVR